STRAVSRLSSEKPTAWGPRRSQKVKRRQAKEMTMGAVDSKIKNKNSLLGSASQTADPRPTFRRPKIVLPVPTPALKLQKVQLGVPDTQLTREATGLLHE